MKRGSSGTGFPVLLKPRMDDGHAPLFLQDELLNPLPGIHFAGVQVSF
jgi:hypothetical protein